MGCLFEAAWGMNSAAGMGVLLERAMECAWGAVSGEEMASELEAESAIASARETVRLSVAEMAVSTVVVLGHWMAARSAESWALLLASTSGGGSGAGSVTGWA